MDNRYYNNVIGEMNAFLEENGFKADGEIFKNEKNAIKISYNEARQTYDLFVADIEDGKVGEFKEESAYLFDDSQLERDAASVGIDFVDTLKKRLGIKAQRRSGSANVELPTAYKGDAVTVNTLTSKLLAVYPTLKDTYKSEVELKGKYLYLDFMTTYVVPEIRATLDSNNKKSVKKLIDMLVEMFVQGDNATSTLVVALLAAAIGKKEERFTLATEYMSGCKDLISAVNNQISLLVKNKKFAKALKYTD